ncbi:MAG TPA: phenylalanine--tRNA ligase beta subunit-related protein [Amnibacterium sp.]|jgi:DNA/RNA-binding domain of Phe-tRNA-synthetase-like protein|uniref:B3/B4 domain-containing protein n=1 Tax=Amnibacterium sp. TaxID=1872496 RepID=UPI002F935550
MPDAGELERFLAAARVDPAVFALRPDYRAALVAVDGIPAGGGEGGTAALVADAEAYARELLAASPVDELPHVAAWREAYRAFGAKPQRTRNSLEALLRRAAADGLPQVNPLTDLYNAVSVLHQVPLGGEDLTGYLGAPRLIRAVGDEPFDTVAAGEDVVEHPEPGEVVWCDEVGVTCRRWNHRQGRRTRLTEETSRALFILDALAPLTDEAVAAAVQALVDRIAELGPGITVTTRVLAPEGDD